MWGSGADAAQLHELLFAATGRTTAGASLADYYRNQSLGRPIQPSFAA